MRSVHWNTKDKVTLIFVSLDFDRKSRMRMRKTFPTETTTAPVDSAAVLRKTRERNNKIKIIKSPHKATTIIINIAASNHKGAKHNKGMMSFASMAGRTAKMSS